MGRCYLYCSFYSLNSLQSQAFNTLLLLLAGLGYDYESSLAVSPVQRWLTLSTAEVVLTDIEPATWRFMQSFLIPMAAKLGYKPFYPEYRTKRQSTSLDEAEGE